MDVREAEVAAHEERRARRLGVQDRADPAGVEREGVCVNASEPVVERLSCTRTAKEELELFDTLPERVASTSAPARQRKAYLCDTCRVEDSSREYPLSSSIA